MFEITYLFIITFQQCMTRFQGNTWVKPPLLLITINVCKCFNHSNLLNLMCLPETGGWYINLYFWIILSIDSHAWVTSQKPLSLNTAWKLSMIPHQCPLFEKRKSPSSFTLPQKFQWIVGVIPTTWKPLQRWPQFLFCNSYREVSCEWPNHRPNTGIQTPTQVGSSAHFSVSQPLWHMCIS